MDCTSCGCDIESGFAFCPKCGAKQPKACPRCAYGCAPGFRFCPKCGAEVDGSPEAEPQREPISRHAPGEAGRRDPASNLRGSPPPPMSPPFETESDRRTVTVLFADLSGFTTLSEQLDPEVMQSLQNEIGRAHV